MNILYCGDENIIDGLLISILSLLKNTDRVLNIYVLTMKYKRKVKGENGTISTLAHCKKNPLLFFH